MIFSTITDNTDKKRFELQAEGQTAFIDYIKAKGNIYLTHTEVPKGLEGKGVGSALVKGSLEQVDELEMNLIPLCPFVALYIKRHPEWKRLVYRGINVD